MSVCCTIQSHYLSSHTLPSYSHHHNIQCQGYNILVTQDSLGNMEVNLLIQGSRDIRPLVLVVLRVHITSAVLLSRGRNYSNGPCLAEQDNLKQKSDMLN